ESPQPETRSASAVKRIRERREEGSTGQTSGRHRGTFFRLIRWGHSPPALSGPREEFRLTSEQIALVCEKEGKPSSHPFVPPSLLRSEAPCSISSRVTPPTVQVCRADRFFASAAWPLSA